MFGGGSTQPAEQQAADNAVSNQANGDSYQNNAWGSRSCEVDAKQFTKCMDEYQGNMQICGWYLEQLVGLPPLAICETIANFGYRKLASQLRVITRDELISPLPAPGVGTGACADRTWERQ